MKLKPSRVKDAGHNEGKQRQPARANNPQKEVAKAKPGHFKGVKEYKMSYT